MALRNVAKTFSLEQQRVEINELAADVDSLNLNSTTLSSFSVTTNIAGISALSYDSATGIFTYTPPNLSGYLTTSSPAGGITSANITNWDTAYNWGDHSTAGYWVEDSTKISNWDTAYGWGDHGAAGYLTSYTETDPIFNSSPAGGITSQNIANWDAAYGWGDHGTAGYLTSVALNGISDVTITTPSVGDYIKYDGTGWVNSAFTGLTSTTVGDTPPSSPNPGDLWWESDTGRLKIYYQDTDTSQWVDASPPLANPFNVTAADAANWDTAYGWGDHAQAGYITAEADTIATVVARGDIIGNDTSLKFGDAAPTQIYYDSTNNVTAFESNALIFRTKTTPNEDYIKCLEGGAVEIFYDGAKKLGTTSAGVSVLGDLSASGDLITSSKLIHDGDIDTYLSFDTDVIKLTTAGSERITIGSSGQLGLGGSNYGANGEVLTSNGPNSAPSWQSPSQTTGIISVKDYGAVGNGSNDDTTAIQSALNSNHKAIYFPTGDYVISSALTSSLNGRKIYGEGTITTTAAALANEGVVSLEKAFVFTEAEYVDFSLDCDGNNLIEVFAQFNRCLDPHIHHCRVRDLESPVHPTGGKAIAFELFNNSSDGTPVDTGAKITDNYITNLIAHDDDGGVVGRGMARAIAFDTDQTLNKPILIADNVIDTVAGHEGDAISVMSVSGSNYLNANVFITGNHIKDFNRRGCKIKFNSAVISNNTFYNTWTSEPLSTNPNNDPVAQGVVDLVNGENHIVSGNKFINTEYMSQIKIVTDLSETVSNCVIKDNVITQISGATSSSLMYFSSSTSTDANLQGTNLTIKDNSFDVPGFNDYCIRVVRTKNVIIADNTGIINSSATGVHVPGSAANNNLTNVNNNFLVAT